MLRIRQSKGRAFRVNHNPETIGSLAARHLMSLGLRHFAFVGYTHEWRWSAARKRAFLSHLGKTHETFSSFDFPVGTTVPSRIRHDFSRWLAALPHPCGMLLASDGLAGEAYPACVKLGLRIPDDFAVLGVDDNERFCESLRPTLSSILLDFSQAGWLAAELLHRVIDKPTLAPYVMTYEPLGIAPRGSTSVNVNKVNPIAERAKALVAELAVTGANVSDIARHFTCSRRLVELRFRESTGMSLLQAIRDARLDKACELLRNKSIAIGTIATQCGYISESALKAAFKNRFGMTMSDWRRRAHPSLCGETPHLRWGGVRTSPDERVARNCHNHSNISPITLTRQIAAFP